MTWLTWRQFRSQAITALVTIAAFAILLGATGPHLTSQYAGSGVGGCQAASCAHLASSFLGLVSGVYPVVYTLGVAAVVLTPALFGVFWGAPLVARELETGTFRLAWTQTVTRTRWLATKLAVPGLAAIAVAEGLSLMYGWWAAPIEQAARLAPAASFPTGMGPYALLAFDAHGLVPIGYAAFGFMLGVAVGILVRRSVPAMAITLAIFAAVQIAMPLAIRPHLFAPAHADVSVANQFSGQENVRAGGRFGLTLDYIPTQPGAWIMSSHAVNAAGQPATIMPASCANNPNQLPCLADHGIEVSVTYEPTSRYWDFQWTETGIYLALALALGCSCFWLVRRRLT
jgi:hypothetical protein